MKNENQGWSYEPQKKDSGFLALKQKNEQIKIRVVSEPYIFNEIFTKDTGETTINKKFAIVCIDRADGKVKSFKGGMQIFKAMKSFKEDEDWGDPINYDFTITRTEEKPNYYNVKPSPNKSSLTDEEKNKIELENIYLKKRYSKFAVKEDENIQFLNENSKNHEHEEESEDIPF
jgi:hypothetical protein